MTASMSSVTMAIVGIANQKSTVRAWVSICVMLAIETDATTASRRPPRTSGGRNHRQLRLPFALQRPRGHSAGSQREQLLALLRRRAGEELRARVRHFDDRDRSQRGVCLDQFMERIAHVGGIEPRTAAVDVVDDRQRGAVCGPHQILLDRAADRSQLRVGGGRHDTGDDQRNQDGQPDPERSRQRPFRRAGAGWRAPRQPRSNPPRSRKSCGITRLPASRVRVAHAARSLIIRLAAFTRRREARCLPTSVS